MRSRWTAILFKDQQCQRKIFSFALEQPEQTRKVAKGLFEPEDFRLKCEEQMLERLL